MTTPDQMPVSTGIDGHQQAVDKYPDAAAARMALGAALHQSGQPQRALVEFEQALALRPGHVQAASACATLLIELLRPQAAYQVLLSVQAPLLMNPDGAANLGIAAQACGDSPVARQCYERALALEPDHLRALNNLALMASSEGHHDEAIAHARRCVELQAAEPAYWLNLSDVLTAARRHDDALHHLAGGLALFPGHGNLSLRWAAMLAFTGQFDQSREAFAGLHPDVLARFVSQLATAGTSTDAEGFIGKPPISLPDPYQLYTRSAFEAIRVCDWRECVRLTTTLRHMLAECVRSGIGRDLRDAQHYGIALGLHENEMAQLREISIATIAAQQPQGFPAFKARAAPHRDGRIHVGIAIQSLRDARFANSLARQLSMHDHTRFALHLYSPTPQPQQHLADALQAPQVPVTEIAHLTDDEAALRMRFDHLDIFLDMAFDTPWCRPEIPSRRVAPVQIRQLTWHRHNPPQPCEYNLSDTFVHPDAFDLARYGAIVRFPHTCWFDAIDDQPDTGASCDDMRLEMGIPENALVLCAFLPGIMIDPATFGCWMQMLHALQHAVLWLSAYNPQIQTNLQIQAAAHGITTDRVVFSPRKTGGSSRAETLARMQVADLFVDALRFNANHGLVDALRMGVPAITCAGNSMASRLGGSIVRAAGLPGCVFDNQVGYLAAAIELGRQPHKLIQLRAQLQSARAMAPLFDTQARVTELEAAWSVMAERARAGLAPRSFDVPSASPQQSI